LLEDIEDEFDSAARIDNITKQIEEETTKFNTNETGLRRTLQEAGVNEADIASYMGGNGNALDGYELSDATVENIKKYTDGATDSYVAMKELRSQVEEEVMKVFELWHEEFEQNGRVFEHASTMVENYKNIIDIVGKDRLGISDTILKELNDAADKAAKGTYENAAAKMKFSQ
jgi:hypothetical protein